MDAFFEMHLAKEPEVLIIPSLALEDGVEAYSGLEKPQLHWESSTFNQGLNMEPTRTRMHAGNEPEQSKAIALAWEPTHCSDEEPLVFALCTDDDLVKAAQSGNREAFTELCRRHAQAVRRRILGIVRHQEDAEDALQETLLRAYANLGRFRGSSKFSTWITAIGINAALIVIRKRKTRREADMELDSTQGPTWDVPDRAPDPERRAANGEIILFLEKKLQSLPPKMREVLNSYYCRDNSLQETAEALSISVAAVKSRLLRGRRSLRSSFEQKGFLGSHL
jgi:RNA polymerase sigma-70 factor (ECF subfamily)